MALQPNYSRLDRLLHRIAFATPAVQVTAADIEKSLFGAAYAQAAGARPIFITSLPRAGTTLMLEAFHQFPSLASHIYRDMPFVLAPVLWANLTRSFRKPASLQERAHGDGMAVGYDSPEAFEEMIWRTFWPEKYLPTRIALWTASDVKPDARAFFVDHMKKIVALRRPDRLRDGRYVSKNNANIARLDLIEVMFPDAKILLPVRQPLEHAWSLLRQHRNFLEMHGRDPFVRRYMADIGHYEFGELHRPIAFPGLETLIAGRDPLSMDYWLAYWIAAFEYIRARSHQTILVPYENCCRDPIRVVADLCRQLDLDEEGALATVAALFKEPPASRAKMWEVDQELLRVAEQLYEALFDAQPAVYGQLIAGRH